MFVVAWKTSKKIAGYKVANFTENLKMEDIKYLTSLPPTYSVLPNVSNLGEDLSPSPYLVRLCVQSAADILLLSLYICSREPI